MTLNKAQVSPMTIVVALTTVAPIWRKVEGPEGRDGRGEAPRGEESGEEDVGFMRVSFVLGFTRLPVAEEKASWPEG